MKNFSGKIFAIRWKLLNYAIILIFLYQIIYCAVTFLNVVPEGMRPTMSLWKQATEVPDEILYKRRLYAIELWVSAAALIVYVAIVYRDKLSAKIGKLVKSVEKTDESNTQA
ncbi:MAG: hypothetical protein GX242_00145 [Clostridiales bacterium]|nr:hypothetical protein [Clostridiales bacterium]